MRLIYSLPHDLALVVYVSLESKADSDFPALSFCCLGLLSALPFLFAFMSVSDRKTQQHCVKPAVGSCWIVAGWSPPFTRTRTLPVWPNDPSIKPVNGNGWKITIFSHCFTGIQTFLACRQCNSQANELLQSRVLLEHVLDYHCAFIVKTLNHARPRFSLLNI